VGISTRQVTVTTSPTILVDNTAEAEEVHLPPVVKRSFLATPMSTLLQALNWTVVRK